MYLLPYLAVECVQLIIINMKGMQKTMRDGRKKNSNYAQKGNPAEQGIKGSKQLCAIGFHDVDRTHAGEDHTGIIEGIDPGKITKILISNSAETG